MPFNKIFLFVLFFTDNFFKVSFRLRISNIDFINTIMSLVEASLKCFICSAKQN